MFCRKIKLFVDEKSVSRNPHDASSHNQEAMAVQKLELELSPSVIAGLFEPNAEQFDDMTDSRLRCLPSCLTWNTAGDVIIGCEDGQLLRVRYYHTIRDSGCL